MIKIITFKELLLIARSRKNTSYFYKLKNRQECFTGDSEVDFKAANKIIDATINDSTAHTYASAFRWAYDQFYGEAFNHKAIHHRPNVTSKFTTRLTKPEIDLIFLKFKEWIYERPSNILSNHQKAVEVSRLRIWHCFLSLMKSGMRLGELININFKMMPAQRFIRNKYSGEDVVEIIINTEKTCKKREIYIPLESYNFFVNDTRHLSKWLITGGFISFRKWSNIQFKFTAHVCRRTLATMMHETGVDVPTIAMVLGNTPRVVMQHYILSSERNYDACEIAHANMTGKIEKINNMYINTNWMRIKNLKH